MNKQVYASPAMEFIEEEWKTVDLYPDYEVSDYGRVRIKETKQTIRLRYASNGYVYAYLPKMVAVHRLVASAFNTNECPSVNKQVDHINEDKTDNRAVNLRWVSKADNLHRNRGIKRADGYRTTSKVREAVNRYQRQRYQNIVSGDIITQQKLNYLLREHLTYRDAWMLI